MHSIALAQRASAIIQNRVPRPNNPYYPGEEYRKIHMRPRC